MYIYLQGRTYYLSQDESIKIKWNKMNQPEVDENFIVIIQRKKFYLLLSLRPNRSFEDVFWIERKFADGDLVGISRFWRERLEAFLKNARIFLPKPKMGEDEKTLFWW